MNAKEPPSPVRLLLLLLTLALPLHAAQAPGWHLTWSDEFNAPGNTPPDPQKWTFETGGKGYGNDELETYTSRPANARQHHGNLVITARTEDLTGPDGIPRHYTSARINTKTRFAQPYGRFEARMKLPTGKGIWPAFWLLGDNDASAGWPQCGEIDIIENIGDPAKIYSTLHGPGYSDGNALSTPFALPPGESVDKAFHLYAVEWSPNDIKFFFDDHLIAHRTPADLPPGAVWVYDHPFFIILNLAVGGKWPGNPDASTTFPQQMLIDYIRVYTRNPATANLSPTPTPGAPLPALKPAKGPDPEMWASSEGRPLSSPPHPTKPAQ